MQPNELRGEAAVRIGDAELTIAVEFEGLARLASGLKRQTGQVQTLDAIYQGLLGFDPHVVVMALLTLTVHPDGPERAAEVGAAAARKLSAADERAWRDAVEIALAGHIDAGRRLRGEKSLAEEAAEALKVASKKKSSRMKASTPT